MRVWQARSTPIDGAEVVSARIDGEEVWFSGPAFAGSDRIGDAYLVIALLAAMAQHRTLDLRDMPAVSGTLLGRIPTIQDLWTQWNAELGRVDVLANEASPTAAAPTRATCFSGGVDAVHAVICDPDPEPSTLIYLDGFDFILPDEEFDAARRRIEKLGDALDRPSMALRTNWVAWRRGLRLSGALTHGAALAATGHLLGVGQMTVASSNSFARLAPWGSHTLADPLWSSDRVHIRHFGADQSRAEKCVAVLQRPDLLPWIWVCHRKAEGNCGRCPKCARTRLMFHLAGGELPVDADAALVDPLEAYLPHLRVGSEHVYVGEILKLAVARGDRHAIARLHAGRRSLERRRLLRDLRNTIFPAWAQKRMRSTDLMPWGYGPARPGV